MNPKSYSGDESWRLRQLIAEIGMPLRRLPDIIEEKPEACLSWWSQQSQNIKITQVHFDRLAKFAGIPDKQLLIGNYDRDLARKRIYGDYQALPERYTTNQNSFLRTSSHIIRYVNLTRGQEFADRILTELNVSPLIYLNTDTKINLTYFADLLQSLSDKGFRQSELDNLASVLFLSLQDTALGSKFQTAENMFEIYETLANNFNYFDTNFDYKSAFVKNKYVLKTVLPVEQHLGLKDNPERLERLMRYRHILLAWFPYLAGLTPLFPKTEIIRSSSGILETQYEFSLAAPLRPRPSLHTL